MPGEPPVTRLESLSQLDAEEVEALSRVTQRFPFRCSRYYLGLINWDDPNDPIRRIVVPSRDELAFRGSSSSSSEDRCTVLPGLQHKYRDTALLLISGVCGGSCRFCFRKRVFEEGNREISSDIDHAIAYISEHKEITNVLLTGGDPLMLSTGDLERVIEAVQRIDHVRVLRIGSKLPAFDPKRITEDRSLTDMLDRRSQPGRRIYLVCHFDHPRELTEQAVEAVDRLIRSGVIVANQTPMISGVNDDPEVMADLFRKLSYVGAPPYYVFQCRPVTGSGAYSVPLERAYVVFHQAQRDCSGLARRARFVMSHSTGKIEVAGMTDELITFRYHRAPDPRESSRILVFLRNPAAKWLDDYTELVACHPLCVRGDAAHPDYDLFEGLDLDSDESSPSSVQSVRER